MCRASTITSGYSASPPLFAPGARCVGSIPAFIRVAHPLVLAKIAMKTLSASDETTSVGSSRTSQPWAGSISETRPARCRRAGPAPRYQHRGLRGAGSYVGPETHDSSSRAAPRGVEYRLVSIGQGGKEAHSRGRAEIWHLFSRWFSCRQASARVLGRLSAGQARESGLGVASGRFHRRFGSSQPPAKASRLGHMDPSLDDSTPQTGRSLTA
jgi:hypothetical protein